MISLLPDADRGHTRLAWLDSAHSFSFGDFYRKDHNGFGVLRVLNEDRVQPGRGFAPHGHANMEILSWVIDGELQHKDSAGNEGRLGRGGLQVMSAGAGIRHSEHNGDAKRPLHFLQIWLQPDRINGAPGWAERQFKDEALRDRLCLLVSPDPGDDALHLRQNVRVLASRLNETRSLAYAMSDRRRAWLQLIRGRLQLNDTLVNAGDGAAIDHERDLDIRSLQGEAEFLLFDMP